MLSSIYAALQRAPMLVRVAPFLIFVGLTGLQGRFGEESRFWLYFAKTFAGAGMVWAVWPLVREMRWAFGWDAVAAGVAIFALWAGMDGYYPPAEVVLKKALCPVIKNLGFEEWCAAESARPSPWNPHAHFGAALAWMFVLVRVIGSTLVVPPLEEVFYRSFLYRYMAKPEFMTVPLNFFGWGPFLITVGIFGFAHHEWLPGILCAAILQGLVIRHNRLGEAMTAHAIANFLLGSWVAWKGAWHFW